MTTRERLKEYVSQHLKGQCKILSKGDDCECALCDMDRIVDALVWYGHRAALLADSVQKKSRSRKKINIDNLTQDAGRRAEAVLGKFLPPEIAP